MKTFNDKTLASSRWLEMIERSYTNRLGEPATWYFASRTKKRPAILVIPITSQTGRVVIVKQYRIILEAWVLEFPAGLVDDHETLAEAANRELKEETGYQGRIISQGPLTPTSSGLTDEQVSLIEMEVGEEPSFEPSPEGSEELEVLTLTLDELGEMMKLAGEPNPPYLVDSRLYSWWLAARKYIPG